MGQAKPWQIVLIVIAVIGSAGSVAWTLMSRDSIQFGNRIEMVDLVTGDRYWIDVSGDRRGTFPAKHPETQQRTLVRIQEDDNGVWKSFEIRSAAAQIRGSGQNPQELFQAVESFETGVIRVSDAEPKQYRPGG